MVYDCPFDLTSQNVIPVLTFNAIQIFILLVTTAIEGVEKERWIDTII